MAPSGPISAGTVTLTVNNAGNFPHQLTVISGTGYKDLPLAADGSVAIDKLASGALAGGTDKIAPGANATLSVDLKPGHYVLLCNLVGGGSSHAARGQVTEIDVA